MGKLEKYNSLNCFVQIQMFSDIKTEFGTSAQGFCLSRSRSDTTAVSSQYGKFEFLSAGWDFYVRKHEARDCCGTKT